MNTAQRVIASGASVTAQKNFWPWLVVIVVVIAGAVLFLKRK